MIYELIQITLLTFLAWLTWKSVERVTLLQERVNELDDVLFELLTAEENKPDGDD